MRNDPNPVGTEAELMLAGLLHHLALVEEDWVEFGTPHWSRRLAARGNRRPSWRAAAACEQAGLGSH